MKCTHLLCSFVFFLSGLLFMAQLLGVHAPSTALETAQAGNGEVTLAHDGSTHRGNARRSFSA